MDDSTDYDILMNLLARCNQFEPLRFRPIRRAIEKIRQVRDNQLRHIRFDTLRERNRQLYARLMREGKK